MKAVRLHKFHTQPVIDDVPEPTISGPFDVIVKIGGAGVCRTDLHIMEGQWDAAMHTPLPYVLGHENACTPPRPTACATPAGPATTCTARTPRSPGCPGTAAWPSTC